MRHKHHDDGGARAVTSRAPVLFPWWCSKGWADGAQWRVEVDAERALVWRRGRDLEPVVLAAPGTVRDVRLATAGARVGRLRLKEESVVFVVDGGAPVVLPTQSWASFSIGGLVEYRFTAWGVRAVVESLGHRDLAWTFDAESVDEVPLGEAEAKIEPLVLDPGTSAMVGRQSRFLQVTVLTLLLPWTVGGILTGVVNWLMFAVSAVITVLVGANMVWGFTLVAKARRRFAEPRTDVAFAAAGLAPPCELATTRDGMLYLLGPDSDQLLLPGPTRGGVTVVSVITQDGEPRSIDLQLAAGVVCRRPIVLASLDETWWDGPTGAAAVRGWLEAAGVEWQETPAPEDAPRPEVKKARREAEPPWGGRLAFNLCFGAWAEAFSAFMLWFWWPPLCVPGAALFVAWVVARVRYRLRGGRRDHGQFMAMVMEH